MERSAAAPCGGRGSPPSYLGCTTASVLRESMTPTATVTFALIAGVVWGGLLVILATAARSEGRKGREG